MFKQVLLALTIAVFAKGELPQTLFQKYVKSPLCAANGTELANLFEFMCNNIAFGEENVLREACVSCYRNASISRNGQPSLTGLSACSEVYLETTRYQACSGLVDVTSPVSDNGCVTGYCNFVRCVRRANSDLLISQCYGEAIFGNDAVFEADQIILVKNITSCILARSRCASTNPITGQPQTNRITTTTFDKWGKPKTNSIPLYNSLQITPQGDLRIISLPGTTRVQNYFCTAQPNLQESSWQEFAC